MATQKEQIWIAEYLKCWNATEAARRAGYKWPDKQGQEKKAKFASEIKDHIERVQMSADEVLVRLAEHARADVGQYIEVLPGGQAIIDLERAKEAEVLHLIKRLKVTKTGPEIELYDQQAALQLIGKHHGLFTDKIEHKGQIGVTHRPDLSRVSTEDLKRVRDILYPDTGGNQ